MTVVEEMAAFSANVSHDACHRRRSGNFASWSVEESAPLGVRHRLESIVRPKLLIDVVQVVAQRLSGNAQRLRDRGRIAAFGKEREDAALLLRELLHRCVIHRFLGQ